MVGVEPTRRDHRPAAFRERSLRPLGYISRYVYPPENGKNWRIEQQEQDVSKGPGSRINKGFSSIPLLKNLLDFECDLLRPLEYISVSYEEHLYSIRNGAFAQVPNYFHKNFFRCCRLTCSGTPEFLSSDGPGRPQLRSGGRPGSCAGTIFPVRRTALRRTDTVPSFPG